MYTDCSRPYFTTICFETLPVFILVFCIWSYEFSRQFSVSIYYINKIMILILFVNKQRSLSRVLDCDKTTYGHFRTRGKCRKHEPQVSILYISRVFSNAWSVLSQSNTRFRLLHLLYNVNSTRQKTVKRAFSMFNNPRTWVPVNITKKIHKNKI